MMAAKITYLRQKIFVFCTALFISFASQAAQLAIVIDDVGYHPKEDAAIFAMPKQIAVAIIPVAPYAAERNRQAHSQGRDVLIHLPMQPKAQMKIEAGGLTLGMSQQQVDERLGNAKAVVTHAIGLNNHMGSAATADAPLMNKLMTGLQANHLFFLDSRTIGSSVAGKTAKQFGISTLERDIFLDDSDVYADVARQFEQALRHARKHGRAVVIGHPRKNTVAVLQRGLVNLPLDIQLVSVGNLWRHEKVVPVQPFIYLFSQQPAPTSSAPFKFVPGLRGVPE